MFAVMAGSTQNGKPLTEWHITDTGAKAAAATGRCGGAAGCFHALDTQMQRTGMADDREKGLRLFLNRLLRRSVLTDDEQAAILSLSGRVEKVPPGTDVVVPGESTDHSCAVISGLMSRFDVLLDGRRQTVALYIPGEMCDLHSVPVPTSGWGLETLTTSTLLFVPHEELRALIRDPVLALALWRDTTVDGSILAKWVANLGRKQAAQRLAHLLCEIGVRMEQAGLGSRGDFALPMTQSQLADVAGLTPVHLNRTLKLLAHEGVVFARKSVSIADWAALAQFAEFDPAYLLLPPDGEPVA
jgi:CRP-like cAMP-binding protein